MNSPDPLFLPPRSTLRIHAPSAGPTEAAPIGLLVITIADADTGRPIVADVTISHGEGTLPRETLHVLHAVSSAQVAIPANVISTYWVTVEAAGYQTFEIGIRPQRTHSFTLDMPIRLQPLQPIG